MTGQRRPPGYGRAIDAPLQLAVPRRLPGGVWGQQPLTGTFTYDANGFPIDPATGLPTSSVVIDLSSTSQGLSQTEWPIPTRWEIQIGLGLVCTNGAFSKWPGTTGANFEGGIETAIESAGVVQPITLNFGPGVYPFIAAVQGVPGLGSTFPVVAQQVRVRYLKLQLNSDQNLSGPISSTWAWSINTMIGLTAPAIA